MSNASLTVSAVLAIAIRLWDYPISAEARVERTLYTLLSILIGCVVSVLIETLFSKKNPPDAVLEGISRRLNLMETFLSEASAAEFPFVNDDDSARSFRRKRCGRFVRSSSRLPAMTQAFAICSQR